MRYFFHIGYNGFKYQGWQRHPHTVTVQEVIESALSRILKRKISIMGCGRTDVMVHASQFFFHMDIPEPWDFDMLFRLNKVLPNDIAIFEIIPVEAKQHARFDASQRMYDYFLHTYKDPFLSQLSALYLERNLNLDEMKKGTALLTRYNDFRAFCKTPNDYKTTICHITHAALYADANGDQIRFQISANRYLGRMIRLIMAKLLAIGRGEISVDEFESYLITKTPPKSFDAAYPQGLYLSKVMYPYLDIPPRSAFSLLHQQADSWLAI